MGSYFEGAKGEKDENGERKVQKRKGEKLEER